eukprot:1167032-Rhodomonas_salina.1
MDAVKISLLVVVGEIFKVPLETQSTAEIQLRGPTVYATTGSMPWLGSYSTSGSFTVIVKGSSSLPGDGFKSREATNDG